MPYQAASTSFDYKINLRTISNSSQFKLSGETEFKDFPNTSYYSPVSYLPQAIIIFILKKANFSIVSMYYCSRFFVFFIWLLSMFYAIKIMPLYKWLFTFLILLPMNLFITNSFSADTVTVILAFLFIACVFKIAFGNNRFTKKQLFVILALLGLLALAKVVYIGLACLLFLIPASKFNTRSQRAFYLTAIFLFAGLITLYWSGIVTKNYLSYDNYNPAHREIASITKGADYFKQKEYILTHKTYFFKVIANSLFRHPQTYLQSYIGNFGTYLDIPLPYWLCGLAYLVIILLALFETNTVFFSLKQKLCLLITAAVVLFLLLLSQHLTWDAIGIGIVDLLQGRYLIPVLPLLFILFGSKKNKIKPPVTVIAVSFIIILNLCSLQYIYNRFIKTTLKVTTGFYCDAETLNEEGKYATTNTAVTLDNNNSQASEEYRSGKHSIALSPQLIYELNYKFADLSFGDRVEIEAWRKGEDGHLVISGSGKGCDDFYFADKTTFVTYANGWSKMFFTFSMPNNCTNSKAVFFLWNPAAKKIYFDDIKFTIRKKK